MKRLLWIPLLFLCLPLWAAEPVQLARTNPYIAGAGVAAAVNECDSTLVCQNFEGAGYDNSESWTESAGTPDEDYTTTVLRGSQSLLLSDDDSAYFTISATDEISGHFRIRILTDTGTIAFAIRNGATYLYHVGYNSANNKYLANGATLGASAFTVPETHYVWFHWKNGTGANEINRWWYSSSSRTWPGDGNEDINITNGDGTTQANRVYCQDSLGSSGVIIDQVIVKSGTAGLETIAE